MTKYLMFVLPAIVGMCLVSLRGRNVTPVAAKKQYAHHSEHVKPLDATVSVMPGHLVSRTGQGRIGLRVSNGGALVPGDVMNALMADVDLVAYPEGTVVPTTKKVTNNTLYTVPQYVPKGAPAPKWTYETDAYIDLLPDGPLDDRWYEVVVKKLPPKVDVYGSGGIGKLASDGSLHGRFSPGSHPIIRWVQTCSDGGGNTRTGIEFSEPLDRNARSAFTFANLASPKSACSQIVKRWPMATGVAITCENTDPTQTLDFSFVGARGETGVPLKTHVPGARSRATLETGAPRHLSLPFANLPGDAKCREWMPD